jgi:hypothetical protein
MAENKKSFVLYSDSQGLVNQLPDDVAGRLLKHIYAYVNDENPKTDELLLNIAFEPIKMQLKRDLVKYEKKREQWSDAGKKSAEQRALTKSNESQRTLTNVNSVATVSTVNDNVNVNVNVISKDINIPTWDLFLSYGKEKEPSVKISALKHKYDAWVVNGWKNGNDKPIKNWKSALLQTLAYIEKEQKPKDNHIPLRI